MTSQDGLKVDPLYSFMNEITTFFMITKKQAKISWLHFLCIGIMRLWLQLYKYIFMTSLITRLQNRSNFEIDISPSIFELEYRSKAQISEMLIAIFLIYSISAITFGKKFVASSKWRPFSKFEILNTASNWPQIWKDRPKLCQKKFFLMVMTSSMTSQGGLKVSLYIHV